MGDIVRCLYCMIFVLVVFCGCSKQQNHDEASNGESATESVEKKSPAGDLTVEEARKALIKMIENRRNEEIIENEECLDHEIAHLKYEKACADEEGVITIGDWKCRLKKRAFYISLSSPENGLLDFSGEFELNEQGKWEAHVMEIRRT